MSIQCTGTVLPWIPGGTRPYIKTLQYTTIKIYIKYIKIVKNIKTIAHTKLLTVVQAPQRGLSPVPG